MPISRKTRSDCPIERCISVVSGRWKAMILWRLFIEPQRYSVLEGLIPGVAQRALSQALAELAGDGVIIRRGELWALTPLGEAMRPALSAMFTWGSLLEELVVDEDDARRPQEAGMPGSGQAAQEFRAVEPWPTRTVRPQTRAR